VRYERTVRYARFNPLLHYVVFPFCLLLTSLLPSGIPLFNSLLLSLLHFGVLLGNRLFSCICFVPFCQSFLQILAVGGETVSLGRNIAVGGLDAVSTIFGVGVYEPLVESRCFFEVNGSCA
jgi:hypothetical protein